MIYFLHILLPFVASIRQSCSSMDYVCIRCVGQWSVDPIYAFKATDEIESIAYIPDWPAMLVPASVKAEEIHVLYCTCAEDDCNGYRLPQGIEISLISKQNIDGFGHWQSIAPDEGL